MSKLIRILQIGGFIVAIIGLFHTDVRAFFLSGFAVHVVGDTLFIKENGL